MHDPGDDLQHMIARGMAQTVIHRLEVIEIDMHHREPLSGSDQPLQHRVQRAAVFQPRQRIGKGLFLCSYPRLLQAQVQATGGLHRG